MGKGHAICFPCSPCDAPPSEHAADPPVVTLVRVGATELVRRCAVGATENSPALQRRASTAEFHQSRRDGCSAHHKLRVIVNPILLQECQKLILKRHVPVMLWL